jgi:di/tripeptidase
MGKLSQKIREMIRDKAVTESFQPRADALKKREAKLAVECYNAVFPKKVRDAVSQVPEAWFLSCACLRFNAAGWNVTLTAEKKMPTPFSHGCANLGSLTGDLADKAQAIAQEKTTLEEEFRSAKAKMLAFLEGFASFKQLREAWPEGKKFYADFDVEHVAPGVPAVITTEINNMLGLKRAKAAA